MNLIISTIQDVGKNFVKKKINALLTCPNGNIMLIENIKNMDLENITNIYIIILKNEVEKIFNLEDFKSMFNFTNKNVIIDLLTEAPNNQPQTIFNCINKYNINGPICIKDYKSIFKCKIEIGNYVYYNNSDVKDLHTKAFLKINNLGQVINISEKEIISSNIYIGLCVFKDKDIFINNFNYVSKIKNLDTFHISHIILNSIINNDIFYSIKIDQVIDLTFYNNWKNYCSKYKTLFIDIDGTLVNNSGEFTKKKWGETDGLKNNIKYIQEMYETGTIQIILTTARKEKYREKTLQQLKSLNIPYDKIIFDLFHCKRYLINDYSDTNPYPSAISINLERNNDELEKLFFI